MDEMSNEEIIREAMRLLGSRTSERKKRSSRANAKRPRTPKQLKPVANGLPSAPKP